MKNHLLVIFCFSLYQLNAQPFDSDKLLGTWELKSTEDASNDETSILDTGEATKISKKVIPEIILFFQAGNVLDLIQSGSQFKAQYQIQDSSLYLGTTEYLVILLTSTELTIINKNELFPTTYKYVKTKKKIEPIKEVETIEEFYPNGQLKVQGTKERGYTNGIWTEWFQNGRVKSISHFNNEALLMKIEFDLNGKVSSKTRINFQTGEYIEE